MKISQDINIDGLIFQCELDNGFEGHKKYVMLRSYEFQNNVIYDTELYFVEKDLLSSKMVNYLVYPVQEYRFKTYSTKLIDFNSDMFGVSNEDLLDCPLVYNLVDKNNNEIPIKTSKLKLYKPHVLSSWDRPPMILHVYSLVNNVKVHLITRPISYFTDDNVKDNVIQSESEKTISHSIYSEYLSIEIPNIDYLFSGSVYFENNLNYNEVVSVGEDEKFYEQFKDYVVNNNGVNLLSLRLYNVPYYIKTLTDVKDTNLIALSENIEKLPEYVKCYVPEYLHSNRLVDFEFPVTILLHPYKEFNEDGLAYYHENYSPNADVFFEDSRIRLSSKFGFDENGYPAIINNFLYPNKSKFKNFAEAYQYFNGVDLHEYENIIDDDDEWWDENTESTPQLGVRLSIYSDKSCKPNTKIYSETYFFETDASKKIREVDDFTFSLRGIFSDWNQYPDIMFGKCIFIDKYIGKMLFGTTVYIDKEQFKYLVNTTDNGKVSISKNSTNYSKNPVSRINAVTKHDIINKFDAKDMDLSKINLLNNVSINLIEKTENVNHNDISHNQYTNKTSGMNTTKVIYKPIFYRVQSLQSINILPNVGQNIGVNLMSYMTKVETFKMIIGNYTILESARNNAYVIFYLSASIVQYLASSGGSKVYYITNQDDELISSGTWSVS